MQIVDVINKLTRELGIACCGEDKDGVGESIMHSLTSFRSDIKSINPGQPIGDKVEGGTVSIKLDGTQQPEAARTLDSVIGSVLKSLNLVAKNYNDHRRQQTPDFDGTGRRINFDVPDEKAALFTEGISTITRSLRDTPELKVQYKTGTAAVLHHVDTIVGTKSFVNIVVNNGYEILAEEAIITPPHFNLRIQGTPTNLANEIAKIMGMDASSLSDSDSRNSRDIKKVFTGGKDVIIDLSHAKAADALGAIQTFVARIQAMPPRDSGEIDK